MSLRIINSMSLRTWIKLITILTALLTSIAMVFNSFKDEKIEPSIPLSTLESLDVSEELVKREVKEVTVKPKDKVHKFKIKIDFEYQYDVKVVNINTVTLKSISIEEQTDIDRVSFKQINLLWDLYCSNLENNLKCKE